MSRDIRQDLSELQEFLTTYSLDESLSEPDFVELLTRQHKKYHALLTLVAEMRHQQFSPVPEEGENSQLRSQTFYDYLAEAISDLGSALFVWCHGAYKASRLILRSSIENLFKCMGCVEFPEILHRSSTYEVIEISANTTFFLSPDNQMLFNRLRNIYSELCADVHTATVQQMQHVSSLGFFPHFAAEGARGFEAIFARTSKLMLTILALAFRGVFQRMHYKNKDIVFQALDADVRRALTA